MTLLLLVRQANVSCIPKLISSVRAISRFVKQDQLLLLIKLIMCY